MAFLPKVIQLSPIAGETTSLSRTYTDKVADSTTISVSYNGQNLPGYAAGSPTPMDKYYFTYATSYPSAGITIIVYAHQAYKHPDYNWTTGTGAILKFNTNDRLIIQYAYEV